MSINRRDFNKVSGMTGLALAFPASLCKLFAAHPGNKLPYKISLAQWSLHRAFRNNDMDSRDFAKIAKESFNIEAIEYSSQFLADHVSDKAYMNNLNKRANDHGVKQLLIMCDNEGMIGDPSAKKRTQAIENHYKWIEAAKTFGCHSIRVNAGSSGDYKEQIKLAADGLARLSTYAADHGLNVIVENHGGLSSNGAWLASVMRRVNLRNCGTLPDFGNFRISNDEVYDHYKGVKELMPFAFAVSAKSYDFNKHGNDTHTDYYKMMKIVINSGYHGYVGIEYEGREIPEMEGIKRTQALLVNVRKVLS
jgi:sugar phosphate isomerase/epimerase